MAPGVSGQGPTSALVMAGRSRTATSSSSTACRRTRTRADSPARSSSRTPCSKRASSTVSVPAEYGRFQGGVVQTITRSGGNTVAGSLRVTVTNDNWRALTPYRGDQTLNRRVPTWEAVLGGPAVKNRLYYFGAALGSQLEQGRTLAYTRGNYTYGDRELKYQLKGTWTPSKSHTFRASYFGVDSSRTNASTGSVMDTASLYDNESPESLAGAWYNTVLSSRLLVDAHYSRRWLTYRGRAPATSRSKAARRSGTARGRTRASIPPRAAPCVPARKTSATTRTSARACGCRCPPRAPGRTRSPAGVDAFQETRRTNAYQSGSSYRVRATRSIIAGDAVYPVFLADRTTWIYWQPILKSAVGNDLRTYSAFASDTWRPSGRLTIKAGVRFDLNDDRDSAGSVAVHDASWSPRLAAAWDPTGRGAWLVNGGWSRYVTSINSNVADAASAAGRPATYVFDYLGPAINASGPAMTPPHDALRQLFDWFLAPGTARVPRSAPVIPGVNVQMDAALGPLDAREIALGVSRRLGTRGSARVDGIYRRYLNFYATRRDTTTGKVTSPQGTAYDLALITNATTDATRTYKGLLAQASYRPSARIQLFGLVHAGVDERQRGRRGRRSRADDGHDRRLPGVSRDRMERAIRPARHRPAPQDAPLGHLGTAGAARRGPLRPGPRSASRNRPRLERGRQHQPAGLRRQSRVPDAADRGAVRLQPAGRGPDRDGFGHGPVAQLVASDSRHEEGAGVRASRAGQRVQPIGGHPGEQDRPDP